MVSSLPLSQVTLPALISPSPLSKLPDLHHDPKKKNLFFFPDSRGRSKRGLSQIWLQVREESRKAKNSTVHDGYMLEPIV